MMSHATFGDSSALSIAGRASSLPGDTRVIISYGASARSARRTYDRLMTDT